MPTHTRLDALFLSCENYLLTHYQHDVPTEIYFSILLVDCTCKLRHFLIESFSTRKSLRGSIGATWIQIKNKPTVSQAARNQELPH